ncbi:hypothetical protein CTAYLR_007976 [Chrysophaeum taylorii]|uniref:Sulfhydryl oxidase n=1 Tax=Chrysophaeum taylorii TaxID=2483200 RepID=A0AAD7U9Z9_9STRA|nr:hypothetical protein CTAYLR_007976 [Chrysophaeum taylorii]
MCGVAAMVSVSKKTTDARMEVVTLEQSLFKTVISGSSTGGPNAPETTWAVFFYKPYCGACRRVRPIFHALATTTNHTKQLRFGEIDCVKWRPLCNHAGAKSQPVIKIYSAKETGAFPRREVASWQGVLIAYEVLGWFVGLQSRGAIDADVVFASDEVLAEAMRKFKESGDHRVDRTAKKTANPRAYLDAVDRAWRMGLHDAVFQRDDALGGERLVAMAEWLDALGYALPAKPWRDLADKLRTRLVDKQTWSPERWAKLLKSYGVAEPSFDRLACGYPCSLWQLFHALLANSDRHAAPHVLKAIQAWVVNFFGCSECAEHFGRAWAELRGDSVDNAFAANLWLWRVHNAVSKRLIREGDATKISPWPTNDTCTTCFKSYHERLEAEARAAKRKKKGKPDDVIPPPEPLGGALGGIGAPEDDYDEGYVFQFLAETYCFNSDTFVCAAFDDPSRARKHRLPILNNGNHDGEI